MNAYTRLLDGATKSISELPHLSVRNQKDDVRIGSRAPDRIVSVVLDGQAIPIVIEAKPYGYPRDVKVAVNQLVAMSRAFQSEPHVLMFVAPSIPDASRKILQERGIGYWDIGGSLHLPLPGAYYLIDREVPSIGTRTIRNIYRGRTGNVLHAMLLEPEREWHVHDLASRADVAMSTVHQVLVALEDQEWVSTKGKGPRSVRVLQKPGLLLDAWAEEHSMENYDPLRFYKWGEGLDPFLEALAARDIEYALTLTSGASRVAPYATGSGGDSVLVPLSAPVDEVAQQAGLEPVDDGETLTLYRTDSPSALLFRQRIDAAWVASDVQLYLDLWNWPRRGREQARHLRAERLGY